jgi:hypothetical protein
VGLNIAAPKGYDQTVLKGAKDYAEIKGVKVDVFEAK